MKHDNAIGWRAAQLAARLHPALVSALWVIRAASPGYAPAYEQMGIADMLLPAQEDAPETLWSRLVRSNKGLEDVMDALDVIGSPLSREVKDLPPLTDTAEKALAELTDLLSGLSAEECARYYPNREGTTPEVDYGVPLCVLRLLLGALDIRPGSRLYDPCYGSDALLSRAAELLSRPPELWAQATDPGAYQLCHVRAYLRGVPIHLGEKGVNALSEDLHPTEKFDCILSHPPFNQVNWAGAAQTPYDERWQFGIPPRSNGNFAWLQHIAFHLAPGGHAAVILPNGTLTTRVQSEQTIRTGLLEKGAVEAVIALPPGIFASTRVPCCVWLLSGTPVASTLFVDAQKKELTGDLSEDLLMLMGLIHHHRLTLPLENTHWYAQADLSEIRRRDYLLSPNFYTLPPARDSDRQSLPQLWAQLDSLLPQLSGSPLFSLLPQWKGVSPECRWERVPLTALYQVTGGVVKKKAAFGHGVPMANVSTVIRHPFLPEALPALVEVTPEEMEKYRIRAGDIFLNRSSENVEALACGCVALTEAAAVYGGYLKRLRPLGQAAPDPRYMAAYLRSRVYRQEVARVSPVYTTRSNLNQRQLSQISVYYPDEDRQAKIGETFLALCQFRENCPDPRLTKEVEAFTALFLEQFLSLPITRWRERNGC